MCEKVFVLSLEEKNTYLKDALKKTDHKLIKCKAQLLNKYFEDNLTGLPNIYQLRKDLQDNDKSSIVTISIDNFTTINNFYGYLIGDYVIEKVVKYFSKIIDKKLYRVSGTDFTIIIDEELGFYDLKKYLTELYDSIKNILVIYRNNQIVVSLTLASCVNTKHDDVFSKVSMALSYAKNNALAFWIYEDRMGFENEYEKNIQTSIIVREAVENSKIVPYFQPIVSNKSSKVKKYECLARLIDEKGNIVSPVLFIPVAKKIKVYNHITKIIINKSFDAFEGNDYDFSINLSIEDIMNSEMFDFIMDKLKHSKASNRVIFEIVESEAIQDFKKIARFINEVKRYGARIAIDDFGDGYSNFSYLIKMNVDYLKIDGSLIRDIDTDKNSCLVVETIVEFARKLDIKTIAEFVHSSTVLNKVKELGIDFSQGFYIDEPLVNIYKEV